jgi:hypothetical protein
LKTEFLNLSLKNNCWSTYASPENLILFHSDLGIKIVRGTMTENLILTSSPYACSTKKLWKSEQEMAILSITEVVKIPRTVRYLKIYWNGSH